MLLLAHTCPTVAEDLALDEILLDFAERTASDLPDGTPAAAPPDVLRLWESRQTAVVLGRSSSLAVEANLAECRRRDVPVLRRTSGGAAVVVGPGSLMYSVVLSYRRHPQLRAIDEAHRYVLEHVVRAVRAAGGEALHDAGLQEAALRGTSDLAWGERKFSGNSLRCRRHALLYHGTLLYDFPLAEIGALLGTPPRQPDYRAGRTHDAFIVNLPLKRAALERALVESFAAHDAPTEALVAEWLAESRAGAQKYADAEWTSRVP